MHIAIISSSTRPSNNTHRVAQAFDRKLGLVDDISLDLIDLMQMDIPLFHEVETKHPNPPLGLTDASQRLQKADAVLFVSPEYNGSYSPALKNLVDSLNNEEFWHKPIGVISVTEGSMGGIRGALQMQQLVLSLFGFPIPEMMLVPKVRTHFDETGNVLDEQFDQKLDQYLVRFLWFAGAIVAKKQLVESI